ncbi:MAG: phenylalanine--tRNA ligase subunit beta [Cyanobacteria bacterium M5B4]|nr:MAG: phenylalanine--tRNA ligase subunit beta [Cyanobacteria bacterium M5B4]
MRVSLRWLRELVDFDLDPSALAEKLTMAGFEVEDIEDRSGWAEGVVVGTILEANRHPNADKLQVCRVDVGQAEPLQIVCGAANARAGLYVPVATVGTFLPKAGEGLKIKASKLRGERSEGMICSLAELGLEKESSGIHEFEPGLELGTDVRPLLGLDDVILDVTSTANRADALSMVGIAREVAALTGGTLHLPQVPSPDRVVGDWLTIEDSKACPAYIGTVVEGVKVAPSPLWLQQKLKASGMRPINNVVDITNYILLLWGQPLHSFDRAQLDPDLHIVVKFATKGQTFKTLDGEERTLESVNLLITSNDRPVALAGVMGGEASGVTENTTSIMLEAALFDQAVIRRSARSQGLRTEASARYERGVNQATLELASDHALHLLQTLTGGQIKEQARIDSRQQLTRTIELSLAQVQAVLGTLTEEMAEITGQIVEDSLTRLGFVLTVLPHETWQVEVPPYRYSDIERPIDLIEEIARIYGYDQFTENLPPLTIGGYLPPEQEFLRQLRSCLMGLGLTEVLHNSLRLPSDLQDHQIILTNPIAQEYSALRGDLISGLLDAAVFNLSQGNGVLQGFEIGRVFRLEAGELMESDHVAGIMGTRLDRTWRPQPPMDWFMAKGLLEVVFQRFKLAVEFQPDRKDERLHPGRTASLWINGDRLGTFGQIHPQYANERELPEEVYLFELDLELLYNIILDRSTPVFHPFSTFPASDRDIAFFAKSDTSVGEIKRSIVLTAGSLLENVSLFDEYKGEGVPEGHRSLAFRLVYRLPDRTLTDEDVNPVHQKVRDMLEEKFSVILRS